MKNIITKYHVILQKINFAKNQKLSTDCKTVMDEVYHINDRIPFLVTSRTGSDHMDRFSTVAKPDVEK